MLDIARDCGMVKDKRLRDNENLMAVLLYEHLLGKGVTGKFKVSTDCSVGCKFNYRVALNLNHLAT